MSEQPLSSSATHRVLVPLDGSDFAERAIPYASALAGEGGQLVFLRVMSEAEPERSLSGKVTASEDEVEQFEHNDALSVLRESASKWQTVLTGEPSYEVTVGDAAEEILAVAERVGCTFIVMTSHGRGAIGRLAFGSIADRIARATHVPTLIIRPEEDAIAIDSVAFHRILVPYDGSAVASEALPVASSVASHLGIPVHLLHAINPSSLVIPSPMGTSAYSGEIYTEIEDELTATAQSHLDEAARQLGAPKVPVTTEIVEGPPVLAIEDSAKAGDLIVMASHGRSGFRRWLLGSTAEKLIRTGPAPVLLVPAASRVEAGRR
jgi:nucleotide-binding universal stress UspA family protein